MSPRGFVVAVHNRVAKISQPDGRMLYLVATLHNGKPAVQEMRMHLDTPEHPLPTPSFPLAASLPTPASTPHRQTLSERESARISASLATSISATPAPAASAPPRTSSGITALPH